MEVINYRQNYLIDFPNEGPSKTENPKSSLNMLMVNSPRVLAYKYFGESIIGYIEN